MLQNLPDRLAVDVEHRAASLLLIPSTWHARRTRLYRSTEYISPPSARCLRRKVRNLTPRRSDQLTVSDVQFVSGIHISGCTRRYARERLSFHRFEAQGALPPLPFGNSPPGYLRNKDIMVAWNHGTGWEADDRERRYPDASLTRPRDGRGVFHKSKPDPPA
jgi:hypothetical protein